MGNSRDGAFLNNKIISAVFLGIKYIGELLSWAEQWARVYQLVSLRLTRLFPYQPNAIVSLSTIYSAVPLYRSQIFQK